MDSNADHSSLLCEWDLDSSPPRDIWLIDKRHRCVELAVSHHNCLEIDRDRLSTKKNRPSTNGSNERSHWPRSETHDGERMSCTRHNWCSHNSECELYLCTQDRCWAWQRTLPVVERNSWSLRPIVATLREVPGIALEWLNYEDWCCWMKSKTMSRSSAQLSVNVTSTQLFVWYNKRTCLAWRMRDLGRTIPSEKGLIRMVDCQWKSCYFQWLPSSINQVLSKTLSELVASENSGRPLFIEIYHWMDFLFLDHCASNSHLPEETYFVRRLEHARIRLEADTNFIRTDQCCSTNQNHGSEHSFHTRVQSCDPFYCKTGHISSS